MNREDRFYHIHSVVTEYELEDKFQAQLKRMKWQERHKYKDVLEQWEYALDKLLKD